MTSPSTSEPRPQPPSRERVLVLGATGYVGGRLAPRLVAGGYRVRCLVRSPSKLAGLDWAGQAEVVAGDLVDDATLDGVFDDVDVVVHLVHSMGHAASFSAADRQIATTVAGRAARSGVRRIVYLGGLGDPDGQGAGSRAGMSEHLRSRTEVGQLLAAGPVPTTIVRAAVIIGSGSASFEMLRHLVERLPVMVTPRWVRTRVQPIAIRDVLRYLAAVIAQNDEDDHVYDIGGPDVLTYLEMMRQYAEVAGLPRRLVVQVPVLTPRLSSLWVGLVTPVPPDLAKPLVHSLSQEVVVRPGGEDIGALAPGPTLPYRRALELALDRIRGQEVQTSWRDAELASRSPAEPYPGDPEWTGGTLVSDVKQARTQASPRDVFATVCAVGGDRGWPSHGWAWALRGWIDQLVGGVGLRRGRRDPERLRVGDALDFWRVEEVRPPQEGRDPRACEGVLRLRAEMRLPGRAWLEFRVTGGEWRRDQQAGARERWLSPEQPGAVLHQRALFAPKGLLGRLYWWAMLPFHAFIFATMVRTLAQQAERLADLTSSGAPTEPPAERDEADDAATRVRRHDRSA